MTAEPMDTPTTEGPRFLSVAAVARILGVSEVTLYRAIHAGEFPAVRIRGRLIVPAKAIQALADAAVTDHSLSTHRAGHPKPTLLVVGGRDRPARAAAWRVPDRAHPQPADRAGEGARRHG